MGDGRRKVLFIGFGNPGRLDDGLGPALAALVEQAAPADVTVDSDYQLTIEDAAAVAEHDVVVFADAAVSGPEPFSFEPITPKAALSFSSHSVEPPAVLALADDLFGKPTVGYMLGVRGYAWNEFAEQLSERARANLDAAAEFILPVLRDGNFEEAVARSRATARATAQEDTTCKTENT